MTSQISENYKFVIKIGHKRNQDNVVNSRKAGKCVSMISCRIAWG